jgi:TolB protein
VAEARTVEPAGTFVPVLAFVRGSAEGSTGTLLLADASGATKSLRPSSGRPSWSPDGSRLVFQSGSDTSPSGTVHIVRADGSDDHAVRSGYYPDWSPDGTRLAFSDGEQLDGVTQHDLWISAIDGRDARQLTETSAAELMPAWSPDGRTIAFLRVQGSYGALGLMSLWTIDVASGTERKLSDVPGGSVVAMDWSPRGDQIAYSCGGDVCVVDVGSGTPRRITSTSTASENSVSWSSDGRTLLVSVDPDGPGPGTAALWTMRTDGSAAKQITTGSEDDYDPAWVPR